MNTVNQTSFAHAGDEGKTLILVRHAKSSWDNVTLTDFERPLNERGEYDAPKMAKRLFDTVGNVDVFISSPAKRAKKTAGFFIKEFGRKEKEVIPIPALYDATVEAFYQVINEINNGTNSVVLFSHNPGITSFANTLTTVKIDNMPTCGVFAVKSNSKTWGGFKNAETQFLFFDYPKKTTETKGR